MKHFLFYLFFLFSSLIFLNACIRCDESTGEKAGLMFKNLQGRRIQSPYSKVYEKTILKNIDSLSNASRPDTNYFANYILPFPSIPNPKTFCFIFEKPNGQKDSLSVMGELYYKYGSRNCGIITKYKNLKIIPEQTSFPTNSISIIESKYLNLYYFQYELRITL